MTTSKALGWLFLLVVATDSGWEVSFDSHPDNRAVGLTIQCDNGRFLSINRRDIEGAMNRAWFPRPGGMSGDCVVSVWVVRWVDEDPSREYVAEEGRP